MSLVVLKVGGAVAEECGTLVLGLALKHNVCVVHGAGPQISAELERSGLEVRFVDGRRVTSSAALAVVRRSFAAVNEEICSAIGHRAVSLFTLDQVSEFTGLGHDGMRAVLTERHAVPLEELRGRVRQGEDVPLYRAITRFLFEDGNTPEYSGSRAALQRDARARAYVVIQRSKAWGDFLAQRFPGSVRLSIHPQPCSTAKLGIHLGESTGTWLTPWHGVAVDVGGRLVLMKRSEAEGLNCDLVERAGRPSHFVLRDPVRSAHEDTARRTGWQPAAATVPAAPKEW